MTSCTLYQHIVLNINYKTGLRRSCSNKQQQPTVLPCIERHVVISEFYQNPLQLQLVPITACRYRVRCRHRARYGSHGNTRPVF